MTHAMDDKNDQIEKPNLIIEDDQSDHAKNSSPESNTEVNLPSPKHAQNQDACDQEQDNTKDDDKNFEQQPTNLQKSNPSAEQPKKETKKKQKKKKKKKAGVVSAIEKEKNSSAQDTKAKAESKTKNEQNNDLEYLFKQKGKPGASEFDYYDMVVRVAYLGKFLDSYANKVKEIDQSKHNALHLQFEKIIIRKYATAVIESFKRLKNHGISDAQKFMNIVLGDYAQKSLADLKVIGQVGFDEKNQMFIVGRPQIAYALLISAGALGFNSLNDMVIELFKELNNLDQTTYSTEFISDSMGVFIVLETDDCTKLKEQHPLLIYKPDWVGVPLLVYAAYFNNPNILNYLISKRDIKCDVADAQGRTALMIAASCGNKDAVRTLLGCGAQVTAKDKQGNTALDYAQSALSMCGHENNCMHSQIIELLKSPPVIKKDEKIAKEKEATKIKQAILAAEQKKKQEGPHTLNQADIQFAEAMHTVNCALGWHYAMDMFEKLQKENNPNAALYIQIASIEIRKFACGLLEMFFHDAEINSTGKFKERYLDAHLNNNTGELNEQDVAQLKNNTFSLKHVASLLLRMQRILNDARLIDTINRIYMDIKILEKRYGKLVKLHETLRSECTLHRAIIEDNQKVLATFLKRKNDLETDSFNTQPIIYALYHNNKKAIDFFIACFKNDQTKYSTSDERGRIPLLFARDQYIEVIRARTNFNPCFIHALIKAMLYANAPVVKALLVSGANPNAQTEEGLTPLSYAYRLQEKNKKVDFQPIIKTLFEYGANLNTKNEKGHTPLFTAIFAGKSEVVELLLRYKVDLSIKCHGQICFDLAKQLARKSAAHTLIFEMLDKAQDPALLAYKKAEKQKKAASKLMESAKKKEKAVKKQAFDAWKQYNSQERQAEIDRKKEQELDDKAQTFASAKIGSRLGESIQKWHHVAAQSKRKKIVTQAAENHRKAHLLTNGFKGFKKLIQTAHAQQTQADNFNQNMQKQALKDAFAMWQLSQSKHREQEQQADAFRAQKTAQYSTQLLRDTLSTWQAAHESNKKRAAKLKAMVSPFDAINTQRRLQEAQDLWAQKNQEMEAERKKFAEREAQKETQRKKKLEQENPQLAKALEIYQKHINAKDGFVLKDYVNQYGAIDPSFKMYDPSKDISKALEWYHAHITAVVKRHKEMGGTENPICLECRQHCKPKIGNDGKMYFEWPDYFDPIIEKEKQQNAQVPVQPAQVKQLEVSKEVQADSKKQVEIDSNKQSKADVKKQAERVDPQFQARLAKAKSIYDAHILHPHFNQYIQNFGTFDTSFSKFISKSINSINALGWLAYHKSAVNSIYQQYNGYMACPVCAALRYQDAFGNTLWPDYLFEGISLHDMYRKE
jgi:ankyrin repeat protein